MGLTYVYSLTHAETRREYVGISSSPERRLREHRRANRPTHISRALAKYGAAAFAFKIEAALPTRAEADIAERILIATRKPAFNMTAGGEGCPGLNRGPVKPEVKAKIAAALTGRPLSPEHRAKLSAVRKGKKPGPMSAEQKAKISASRKGKRISAEGEAKRNAACTAFWQSAEGREIGRRNAQKRWQCR